MESVSEAMQGPFSELTKLELKLLTSDDTRIVDHRAPLAGVPGSFLGGSVPRLRSLYFEGVPFPGLPRLLVSFFDLVELILSFIPLSGYFSPEVMVTSLSALTGLEHFSPGFQSYQTRPDQNSQCPPPPMRAVLPVLRTFFFEGANEYLEDLVTWIDALKLTVCSIDLHGQSIYDIPHFSQFIDCSTVIIGALVHVDRYRMVSVKLPLQTQMSGDANGRLRLDILD
jgi:hypothetical protein